MKDEKNATMEDKVLPEEDMQKAAAIQQPTDRQPSERLSDRQDGRRKEKSIYLFFITLRFLAT